MIAAGTLVLLSHGSYSDYMVKALVRAKHDLEPVELRDLFFADPNRPRRWGDDEKAHQKCSSEYAFIAWLLLNGHVEEVESQEWCVGEYAVSVDGKMWSRPCGFRQEDQWDIEP